LKIPVKIPVIIGTGIFNSLFLSENSLFLCCHGESRSFLFPLIKNGFSLNELTETLDFGQKTGNNREKVRGPKPARGPLAGAMCQVRNAS
jgi:hypothetical protein